MTTAKLMEDLDDYIERKVRSIVVQLNLIHCNELRKQTVMRMEDEAKDKFNKSLHEWNNSNV